MDNAHMYFILDHIAPRVEEMEPCDITDCEGLFDPVLWKSVPPSERRHIFGRPISMLIAQGKVKLEFIGFNKKRHNLYRKK